MRYWWVNHNQTAREELGGGYLWSPKREAKGARSQFYDNMRLAEPGDAMISYSRGVIGNVGIVRDFASPASKPNGFGSTGENWSNDGWLLPVEWRALEEPVRPKDRIAELGPLLPAKYSPVHQVTGKGNQKAYLAEINQTIFELLVGKADLPTGRAIQHLGADDPALTLADEAVEREIAETMGLDTTTKQQLILARLGQGLFRARIFEFETACRLTAIETPHLLIASHVKPWRVCSTAAERLDGANGLLLAPHVDRLFDRGLIGFDDSGAVLLSSKLDRADLERLGLSDACARGCGSFHDRQRPYLEFHRTSVFIP